MKAHTASRINAIILIVIGAWGYVESGSLTSNIPVFIGLVLLLLNKGIKNQNKLIAHIAVIVTLLSFANIMPLKGALEDGRNDAALRVIIMLTSSAYAMIYFIKSFIEARKK
jgi:hypothetical protein